MGDVDEKLVEVFREIISGQLPWPLLIYGAVGAGKTRAALCLCDFAASASYWSTDQVVKAELGGDDTRYQLWHDVERKDLVVLDEIGQREKIADLHSSTLQTFLDTREHHSRNIGVYISNVAPNDLGDFYDDRIVSRLLAGTVFHLDGDDRRVK